jgi:hypothetical protein
VRAVGIATGVTILLALLVAWFSWPAKELEPRDLPVVVAAPGPAAQQLAGQLEATRPGAFEVTVVADEAAADAALRDRSAYAAFVAGPSGVSLHTASGASPTVAALLTQAAQQMGAQSGSPVTVVDVVPGAPDDPRGAGFASGFLPLVLASMVAGVALAVVIRDRVARLVGLAAFAVIAGLVGAGVLLGLDLVAGGYLAVAGAIGLLALAVSAAVAGLGAVLGPAGIGLGVLLIFLLGNPISGVAAAPELLPQPWGAIGQLLPVGAGGTLMRSVAFFDGAGSAAALWTLIGWAAVGLVLVAVGRASLPGHATTPAAGREAQVTQA